MYYLYLIMLYYSKSFLASPPYFLVFEQCFEGWGVWVLPKASGQGVDICEGPPPDGEQRDCSTPAGTEGYEVHQAGCDADWSWRGEEGSSAAPRNRLGRRSRDNEEVEYVG